MVTKHFHIFCGLKQHTIYYLTVLEARVQGQFYWVKIKVDRAGSSWRL